ncbi:MAG: hypothetical protein WCH46_01760 [bacterium]
MKNYFFLIVIFFWVVSMISKSKRKRDDKAEIARIRALNNRVERRVIVEPTGPQALDEEQIRSVFAERQNQAPPIDYELAYNSTDYEKDNPEAAVTEDEHEPVSHFKKNYGMVSSLGTESSEEKEAYDKEKKIIPNFSLGDGTMKQYIVAAEILGKPKALRR